MQTKAVYLDNASTSHPKPDAVWEIIREYIQHIGASPGRSGSHLARRAEELVKDCRRQLATLLGAQDADNIVFTVNATHALNTIIKGVLKQGDHVIYSSFEHNSVIRPIEKLKRAGLITSTVIECDTKGDFTISDFESAITANTRLLVINHASNVIGMLTPIEEIICIAHKHKVLVLVDASQTTGFIDIDVAKLDVDFLAFTGHKSLLGPSGTGGFYAKDPYSVDTLMEGGSGSNSQSPIQPGILPDKFEAGTVNYLGLAGLGASLQYLSTQGFQKVRAQELSLLAYLLEQLPTVPGITIYGSRDVSRKVPVVSFNLAGIPANEVSAALDDDFKIVTRPGLQCAPLVHKSIGTFPTGTVRVSLGIHNTSSDIDYLVSALRTISQKHS